MTEKKEQKDMQVVKKKPRGGNNWLTPENMLNVDAGDNAKYLRKNMTLMNLPDINMKDVKQVSARLNEYFDFMAECDSKPTVSGLAMALNGMSRQSLWAIAHDRPLGSDGYKAALPREVTDLIKKAYKTLEILWEDYMNNGKINPVSGIFLGKNNYGYQDKTEYVVTPNQRSDSDYDVEDIRQRYLSDSGSDSGSDSESD